MLAQGRRFEITSCRKEWYCKILQCRHADPNFIITLL